MNTTKDECDGWIDTAVCDKFPGYSKTVLIHVKDGAIWTAYWDDRQWCLTNGLLISRQSVTHWRELPEPPKPKDAFEAWWGGHAKTNYDALVITNGDEHFCAGKEIARYIWEASINSTKQ